MEDIPVGIEAIGSYIPQKRHSSSYIAKQTGIPEQVIIEKFGLSSKAVPGPEDHTVEMGVNASKKVLDTAGILPDQIDVIIWAGEVYAEYPMQTYGIKLQKELGATKAWAFDINQRCGSFIIAMMLAKSMMQSGQYQRVLISSGYRNSDLVNYNNPRTRFLYSLAASGAAVLLKAGMETNLILEGSVISNGSFADDVYVPAGGTKIPMSKKALDQGLHYLEVNDPEGLKERLDDYSMESFTKVIQKSLAKSGYTTQDIDYLALLHMKRSAFEYVAASVGIDPYRQATYFEEYGHMGQNDSIISLEEGVQDGRVLDGDIIVLTAAGIGWAWNALTVRWGSQE